MLLGGGGYNEPLLNSHIIVGHCNFLEPRPNLIKDINAVHINFQTVLNL